MNCPECNGMTISSTEGSTFIIECPECGWSIATTYVDPIHEDETVYSLTLQKGNVPTIERIKAIASLTSMNFIQAKNAIENPGESIISEHAAVMRKAAEELKASGVMFEISPQFPYA